MKRVLQPVAARTGMVLAATLLLILAGQGAAARPALTQETPRPGTEVEALTASSTLVSYQGTLTDPIGNPVNATVTMKFALYDASSGGTLKWGPETQSVQVTNGLFNVLLGSVTPIDPANLAGDLWVEITVNNELLTPRERITSVPYAVEASTLPAGAQTRGSLDVYGNLTVVSPDSGIYAVQLKRLDEENRTHRWTLWHMFQQYGMNSFQIWEYRTDSSGKDCGGDPADGAICVQRLAIWQGGDVCIGCSTGGNLTVNGNVGAVGNVASSGNMTAGGSLAVSGSGFFGGATDNEGALNLQSIAVPLSFKESDESGPGSLWRMPLDETSLRFDSSDDGIGFPEGGFHKVLTLNRDGSIGCGAITENNLQTEEEQAAGGSDRFEEGDLLCWSAKEQRLEKCAVANDPLVQAVADKGGRPIVIGAEAVKVIGPVRAGDYLVASGVPGYAIASPHPTFGIVIAQALEDFDGERGAIKAMIRKM
jgi:hypothetical protein